MISTHTSRVGCDLRTGGNNELSLISTHTSRVGCDKWGHDGGHSVVISTHTSRVGCDLKEPVQLYHNLDFYSHIPCGM